MKNENSELPLRERTVNQVGGDVAVQLMLMMLFACVSRLADDSEAFQTQIRDKLLEITEAVKLPPGTDDIKPEILSAARTVISNVFVGASAIQFPNGPAGVKATTSLLQRQATGRSLLSPDSSARSCRIAGPKGWRLATPAIIAARVHGAQEIVVTDVMDAVLKKAQQIGADRTINVSTHPERLGHYATNKGYFDVHFEASGNELAIRSGLEVLKPRGVLLQRTVDMKPLGPDAWARRRANGLGAGRGQEPVDEGSVELLTVCWLLIETRAGGARRTGP